MKMRKRDDCKAEDRNGHEGEKDEGARLCIVDVFFLLFFVFCFCFINSNQKENFSNQNIFVPGHTGKTGGLGKLRPPP